MNGPVSPRWRVEIPNGGRAGYVGYYEDFHAASFYWEYGGGDVVVIIHAGKAESWDSQYPWAVNRRHEILKRVAQEVIRQKAHSCKAEIDEQGGFIYIREQSSAV